jgi:hypothetical protein
MLGIAFGTRADGRCAEIFETSTQFLCGPAKLFIGRVPEAKNGIMEFFEEVIGEVGAQEAPPQRCHRSWLPPSTGGRDDEYDDAL